LLKYARPFKAGGMDGILNVAVKKLPDSGVSALAEIFNACLRLAYFPDAWKHAMVVPIPKAGKDSSNPRNYRPISLLSTIAKLFEKIVLKKLEHHADERGILPAEQFGFRKGHSTTHQLLRIGNRIRSDRLRRRAKQSTGMVLLDIEKAFDAVWHDGIVRKLRIQGFDDRLVRLIHSFLAGRSFAVRVGTTVSSKRPIMAGVPQGSCISPLLYMLFTADMPKPAGCDLAVYADDVALVSSSRCPAVVCRRLQHGLHKLNEYFGLWRIRMNAAKTQAIYFRHNKKWRTEPRTRLLVNGHRVEWSKEAVYLGITFDSGLTFGRHVQEILRKTSICIASLYPLIGKKSRLSVKGKELIYKAVIRPVISYGAPVWFQVAPSHHRKLQVVQNKCLKLIHGLPYRFSTGELHRLAGHDMLRDYLARLIIRFQGRCADSEHDLITALGDIVFNF